MADVDWTDILNLDTNVIAGIYAVSKTDDNIYSVCSSRSVYFHQYCKR